MDREVQRLLDGLPDATSVRERWSVVESWVERREVGRLRDAALALVAECSRPHGGGWARDSLLDMLVRSVALSEDGKLLRLVRELARVWRPAYLATLVASGAGGTRAHDLLGLGAEPADLEFRACLVQELVLRRLPLGRRAAGLRASLRTDGHPLGRLPLEPIELEDGVVLPRYGPTSRSIAISLGPPPDDRPDAALAIPGAERANPGRVAAATCPFDRWVERSNGHAEARFFALPNADPLAPLAGSLAALGLESLAGARTVRAVVSTPAEAFVRLFAAAAYGGAYDAGVHGAYGRLAAWASVGALLGLDPQAPVETVCATASTGEWFWFGGDSDWFDGSYWTVGIAVARGVGLAILAAADSD